ncbi:hypothetical protein CERSUDRAFT_125395 [Gelatoporia subvermispora B]|uniref:Uncharacterized protein n=1 Tax=Ceriporiopsis subvermispora (strain B) TaxID=914234 RepID=M2R8X3_CERS8|nr:hypothetical protein CERSUDRAFT_125395 [Gelatoporia subvermispora B]
MTQSLPHRDNSWAEAFRALRLRYYPDPPSNLAELEHDFATQWMLHTSVPGALGHATGISCNIQSSITAVRKQYMNLPMWTKGRIAVPEKYKIDLHSMDATSQDIEQLAISLCLNFIENGPHRRWIEWYSGGDVDPHIPQLYIRDDATSEQRASLLSIFASKIPSLQLANELRHENILEPFLRDLLRADAGLCQFLRPYAVSEVESVGLFPLVAIVDGREHSDAMKESRLFTIMAFSLQRAMVALIIQHYQAQGWKLDRELTADDASIMLSGVLYTYSIIFDEDHLVIFANYPDVVDVDDGYAWIFRQEYVATIGLKRPLSDICRFQVAHAMLAIEHHIHRLQLLLGLSYS